MWYYVFIDIFTHSSVVAYIFNYTFWLGTKLWVYFMVRIWRQFFCEIESLAWFLSLLFHSPFSIFVSTEAIYRYWTEVTVRELSTDFSKTKTNMLNIYRQMTTNSINDVKELKMIILFCFFFTRSILRLK
jgi:hypothetical protein